MESQDDGGGSDDMLITSDFAAAVRAIGFLHSAESPVKNSFCFVERAKLACADDCFPIRFCQRCDLLERVDRGFFGTGYDQRVFGALVFGKETEGSNPSLTVSVFAVLSTG
jgi:hypothetical protein